MKKFFVLLILTSLFSYSQNTKIRVYFNHSVDNNASDLVDAKYITNFDDTIVSYIDKAKQSIDVCVYNNSSTEIIDALNRAYYRGIDIRYITDENTTNSALSGLNSNINVLEDNGTGIMHNKFVIIDANDSEDAVLITGSANFTYQSFFQDYNNLIIFLNQDIAQVYKNEFEEMWGSNNLTPDISNAKFGSAKTDNTTHHINVNGTNVDIYFSPTDDVSYQIKTAIYSANNDLFFAQLYLSRDELGDAIINRKNAGVFIRGLMENTEGYGTEYDNMKANGVDVYSYLNEPYLLHHKYCIIDPFNSDSDPILITGSHNWSTSAETNNDENTVFVHDMFVTQEYYEEFSARWRYITDVKTITNNNTKIYYSNNRLNINSGKTFKYIYIYSLDGKLVASEKLNGKTQLPVFLDKSIYIVKLQNDKNIVSEKINVR